MVRPQLEYASIVWHPIYKNDAYIAKQGEEQDGCIKGLNSNTAQDIKITDILHCQFPICTLIRPSLYDQRKKAISLTSLYSSHSIQYPIPK